MTGLPDVLAVVVVRDAVLPSGADEAVAECGGAVLLVGTGTRAAARGLIAAREVWTSEVPRVAFGALAEALAPVLRSVPVVLLPASPDGRDLAARLAFRADRQLFAGAGRCTATHVELSRADDRLAVEVEFNGPVVVTLQPNARGVPEPVPSPEPVELPVTLPEDVLDAETAQILDPDPETVELTEAQRILGAGAGLVRTGEDGAAVMRTLTEVAAALGASAGATRVVTDAGWAGHDRQIGTTGVVVDPALYIAFGVSGAAQHVGGLGRPEHVISVNTDPSCPMTAMADLGIVADAPEVLRELARRLNGAADE
ncbi:electron transfer flavoprotein alpha subunit [Saccharopolyspora antimicrobica]|uniref:Electron transfer flavoprotein alpha subunit n=1 Tax=Saccharopolyspora antimicrobica TaxID=455193 RepID=A0A1I4W4I6_9PSEU|nr:mycofactocin-associated electron transfer flavoprotein alpha subunit [Saccharopolyspora antimicrobica]RKT87078.1 electron transfer flavoprotein alpha subunit apoprotein [Saccharopolyspora antimicrobica]SFN08126.1 electron transfer flavoprotein alpha subunit [Saccharopolyspora antimicrobica]